jgi:predicted dehydrogenase
MDKKIINIALIGYGYWGVNLLRNLMSLQSCNVSLVCEAKPDRLNLLNQSYPFLETTSNADDIFNNSTIDAVVIATPAFTHYELAKKALENGKHVLVEKPLTSTSKQSEELIEIASKKGLQLMVDLTFLYSGAVEKIKELITLKELGTLNYFDSTRINLGLIQPDINVLWDLAPHDLSILFYLQNEDPISVNACGTSHLKNKIENIAHMTLNYKSGFMAHFNCSWSSPIKVRSTIIGGDKKMIVYNDGEPTKKIKLYDSGYNLTEQNNYYYRVGDVSIPKIKTHEPLYKMLEDFIHCINTNSIPISNSYIGLKIVKILEAADKSLKTNKTINL